MISWPQVIVTTSGTLRGALLVHGVALALACACGQAAPGAVPLGEVLVVADTDAPVPKLVARVRVDLFTLDGTWYSSRDVPAFRATDWPVSFGVTLQDGEADKDVLVRLRAYPEG